MGDRPSKSDFLPDPESEYGKGLKKWSRAHRKWQEALVNGERWQTTIYEGEWVWEARCLDLAESYEEYQTLMRAPLREVAMWARKKARETS